MKKVLIVIFTDGRLPKKVYQAALAQDYPHTSILISARRPDPSKSKQQNIIEHMNHSRTLAAASDADYFFFVESAVVIPPTAVSNLILQLDQEPPTDPTAVFIKKHIIGGWYKLTPKLWSASIWIAHNVVVSLMHVEPSVVKVNKIASGCIMLSREVMEKIPWRSGARIRVNKEGDKDHGLCMCGAFGIDAEDAGYELWMDGSVVCEHLTVKSSRLKEFLLLTLIRLSKFFRLPEWETNYRRRLNYLNYQC